MFKQLLLRSLLTLSLAMGCSQITLATESTTVTLKEAMIKATEVTGGEVIKTETTQFRDRAVYKIRLVKEGRVKDVLIDSQNGKVLKH